MTASALAMIAFVLHAAPAPAPNNLERGREAFEAGYFDQALKLLDSAAFEEKSDPARAQIHLLRAQCFFALQRQDDVNAALRLALVADPTATLDPQRVIPDLVQRLEALRRSLHGTVRVRVIGKAAEVTVDGMSLGAAPATGTVSIGAHQVTIRTPETSQTKSVVVRPDSTEEVLFDLNPEPPAPAPAPAPSSGFILLALQANVDPAVGAGGELGLGVGGRHWEASARVLGGGAFGVGLRGALVWPEALGPVTPYAALAGELFTVRGGVPAAGVCGGLRVQLGQLVAPYVELGGRLAARSDGFRSRYVLASAGVALSLR